MTDVGELEAEDILACGRKAVRVTRVERHHASEIRILVIALVNILLYCKENEL